MHGRDHRVAAAGLDIVDAHLGHPRVEEVLKAASRLAIDQAFFGDGENSVGIVPLTQVHQAALAAYCASTETLCPLLSLPPELFR